MVASIAGFSSTEPLLTRTASDSVPLHMTDAHPTVKRHAIPTLYRGRQYRSRLEARWAAFFHLIGWETEYEPFDCEGWIPDFAISCLDGPLLVEVKPIIGNRKPMSDEVKRKAGDNVVLLLGATLRPRDSLEVYLLETEGLVVEPLGWILLPCSDGRKHWLSAGIGECASLPTFTYFNERFDSITKRVQGRAAQMSVSDAWIQAANEVQWRRPA